MAQLRHHGAEVLNALDIVARQVGKEGFVVGQGVMHVAVDEAELGGRAAVCGWTGLALVGMDYLQGWARKDSVDKKRHP